MGVSVGFEQHFQIQTWGITLITLKVSTIETSIISWDERRRVCVLLQDVIEEKRGGKENFVLVAQYHSIYASDSYYFLLDCGKLCLHSVHDPPSQA